MSLCIPYGSCMDRLSLDVVCAYCRERRAAKLKECPSCGATLTLGSSFGVSTDEAAAAFRRLGAAMEASRPPTLWDKPLTLWDYLILAWEDYGIEALIILLGLALIGYFLLPLVLVK